MYYGSIFNGFGKLAKMYRQAEDVGQFETYFHNKFANSSKTVNYNGSVIDLGTELVLRDMSKYGNKFTKASPHLAPSETVRSVALPFITETVRITAEMVQERMASLPYNMDNKQEISCTMLAQKEFARAKDRINRRRELSAIQALVDGMVVDEEGGRILEFPKLATHQNTPTNKWNNLTSSDPIADIDAMCELIYQDGGVRDFEVYMGQEAFLYFYKNPKVQEAIKLLNTGMMKPILELQSGGDKNTWTSFVTPSGNTITIKTYNEVYDKVDGTGIRNGSEKFFPSKKVLIMSKQAPLRYGVGTPAVIPPDNVADYRVYKIEGLTVILKREPEFVEAVIKTCEAPLIPYMDRLGTITALV